MVKHQDSRQASKIASIVLSGIKWSRLTITVAVSFAIATTLPLDRCCAQSGLEGTDVNEAERMLDFNTIELKIQLRSGLRAFQPEQEAFIDTVIAAVDNGSISRAMVNVVYVWAIKRNPKVPFPYFEFVMKALAERRGVTL